MSIDIIDANTARTLQEENINNRALDLINDVMVEINDVVTREYTSSNIPDKITVCDLSYAIIEDHLKELGYSIDICDDYQGYSMTISWAI